MTDKTFDIAVIFHNQAGDKFEQFVWELTGDDLSKLLREDPMGKLDAADMALLQKWMVEDFAEPRETVQEAAWWTGASALSKLFQDARIVRKQLMGKALVVECEPDKPMSFSLAEREADDAAEGDGDSAA